MATKTTVESIKATERIMEALEVSWFGELTVAEVLKNRICCRSFVFDLLLVSL